MVLSPARPPRSSGPTGTLVAATAAALVVMVLLWCLPARPLGPASRSANAGRRPAATARRARQAGSNRKQDMTQKGFQPKVNGGSSWIYECLNCFLQRMANLQLVQCEFSFAVPQTPRGTTFVVPPGPCHQLERGWTYGELENMHRMTTIEVQRSSKKVPMALHVHKVRMTLHVQTFSFEPELLKRNLQHCGFAA